MPPRTTVTPLDLANLKADITDEQMRIRHDQRAELSTKLLIVDNLSVEQKLTNQTIQTMQKTLDTHQEYTKSEFSSLHSKLDKFIEKADSTFATKKDHEQNSKRIDELESDKKSVIKWIVGSSLTIILAGIAAIKTFL